MQKKRLQAWAHATIQRELEEAEESVRPHLHACDCELVYYRVNGYWMFWVQRKRKREVDDSGESFLDETEENFKAWTSGLVMGLVDFAIALESLFDFIRELRLQAAAPSQKPENTPPES